MDQGNTCCPVCTLYLREGISLQAHLETHPKDKVIEALLNVTNNGGARPAAAPRPVASGAAATESFVPAQQFVTPNGTYMQQPQNFATPQNFVNPQNFVTPQTQMTTPVAYPPYITNNGSTVMPQYIQVPTIMAPNASVPMIPNQPINYVPAQQNAYAHTMYNPLYNPYIPQPYPIVQPVYTNMPVTSESNTQVSSSQIANTATSSSSNETPETGSEDSVLKQVSTVATNTISGKNSVSRIKAKKYPFKSTTQTKFRIIKQLGSRMKTTTTSTMATVATKSFKITSINSKNSTAKTSVITTAKSFKTKNRLLLPKPAPSATTTRIISPPPLTLMPSGLSSTVPCSGTPPPPPLSKAPCLPSIPSPAFEIRSIVKTEKDSNDSNDVEESETKPDFAEKDSTDDVDGYILNQNVTPPSNSVIVESNSAMQITSNLLISSPVASESEAPNFEGDSILPRITSVAGANGVTEAEPDFNGDADNFESELTQGSDYDDEQLPENVFQSFEFEEEKKIAIQLDIETDDIPKEISSANIDKNCDGSDIFVQEESIPFNSEEENGNKKKDVPGTAADSSASASRGTRRAASNKRGGAKKVITLEPTGSGKARSVKTPTEIVQQIGETRNFADLKSVTYTDLQPATNSKVLQDLGIPQSMSFNNYMEVDGIKIFFNNANARSVPLEPIIKFTSGMKADMAKAQNFVKSEGEPRENESVVESVIHLVSGTSQKNDFPSETFPNSSSHHGDGHMDLRDLSPLTLNIRADESMPARGELSEQESLGAENSTWGLFHSEVSSPNSPEVFSSVENPPLTILKREKSDEPAKTYKCTLCPAEFPTLKERQLHRSVHETTRSLVTPRKAKTFVCMYCSEKFNSLRDRRRHVIQNHFFDARNVDKIKQESEPREETETRSENGTVDVSLVKVKQETDEPAVKKETLAEGESNKTPTDLTKNCPRCNLTFAGVKKLTAHLKEAHGVSRYTCETCSETFDSDMDYKGHLRIHPIECNQCGKVFNRTANLKLHMKRHLLVKPYLCTQCPKSFITRQKLDEHLNGHSGKKPLKCPLCDSTFSRHSNLIQHRNIHHLYGKKKVKDFVCRCGEVFHSKRKLEWHKEVHDKKPKTCPFCSLKFIHSNSVTRHIRRSHIPSYLPNDKKDENIPCPVCGKIYLRSSLIVHMRVHNGEKPFVCKICNKRFTTKWNLELHNWTHQSRNNMPFKCTICKSAFFREVDYVAHINSHRNYRPFTCNICGQKFIRKYNCLRHQDEHKKEKKFICTVSGCGKSFHRSYYLKDHMKVHTGVRPHTCHICGKASTTKSNHNKHIRIHDTREPLNTEN